MLQLDNFSPTIWSKNDKCPRWILYFQSGAIHLHTWYVGVKTKLYAYAAPADSNPIGAVFQLALRAGNEKEEGETADTVGCCSLRVEHIQLLETAEVNGQEQE